MSYILRATAANGQIRAFCADTTEMVETARKLHNTSKVATAALGRTMTATSMMGVMMKNRGDRITVIIQGDGPAGSIVVTGDYTGNVKGYIQNPDVEVENYPNGKLNVAGAVGNKGVIRVIRDLGLKEPYNGNYELVSGEIAEDFTYYFAVSEQTPSAVSLGVLTRFDEVEKAGGFIIQLMPDAEEEVISKLEKNLKGVDSITNMLSSGMTPEDILKLVLKDLGLNILDKIDVGFVCDCSRDKIVETFHTLPKKDIKEMLEEDGKAEVHCHFCNTEYLLTRDELEEILNS